MKKMLFVALFALCSFAAKAQNVQLHYDFGSGMYDELAKSGESYGRPKLTTTVEMFRPDSFGSTFFFINMDYSRVVPKKVFHNF